MERVAFLGTGLIGGGLAEAAAKRGLDVVVWNRSAEKARALAGQGVRVAESVTEAVRGAARVHLALSDDAAVDQVLASCEGALGEAIVLDHTTTSAAGTRARAERMKQRGVAFLHSPVFMSPAMCRAAQGIMLAAGPRAVFERVEPALAAMTGSISYLGERPDLAAAYKLFGNAMIIAITAGLADTFAMASELGIDPKDAHALFSTFNPAGTIGLRGKKMAEGNFEASFELTMARKDVRLMLEAAGGRPLAVLPGIAARMDALIEAGHGHEDLAALGAGAFPVGSS